MYQSKLSTLLLGGLGIIPTAYTLQANDLQGDSVHVLRDVVVTERVRAREVIPAQHLSGLELKRLSSVSIADALRYFSGVQIKDYGGIGGLKTINVRSMGSQHVGVFYDGVRIGNAQNGQVDLSRFSLDNIEAISIYNGQKSNLLQPANHYASSSAVYMQSRRPIFAGQERQHLHLSACYGSFKTLNPSILYERKLSPNLNVSFNSEYLYTSGEYPYRYRKVGGYDTTAMRRNGDVRAWRVETALFGSLHRGDWQLKGYYYDSERGYPGAVVREIPGALRHEDRQWDRNFFVQSSLRKNYERYTLLLNAKYAYDYLHYLSDPRRDVSTMYVDNHYTQQEVYFSHTHQWQLTDLWRIALASDLQYNTLSANLYRFAYPQRFSILSALSSAWDWSEVRLQASLLHSYYRDITRLADEHAPQRSIITPSLALNYRPKYLPDLSLRAFYKSIFRMPTFNDLYYTFIGSKDLLPEETEQYNVGATYQINKESGILRQVSLEADTYLNYVKNKIIAMPTSNQFQWTMVNLGRVRIAGAELRGQARWQLGQVLLGTQVNYTYQRAVDITDPNKSYYKGQIAYIPWHSGSAVVSLDYKGWSLNYSTIYTGERYDSSANIRENYIQPWYTHDVSVMKNFKLGHYDMRATLEVNNILNQQYEVVRSYPMPGTHGKIKLEWKL